VSVSIGFKTPRGPLTGCHVALRHWFVGLVKKIGLVAPGVRTRDLRAGQRLKDWANHMARGGSCYRNSAKIVFEFGLKFFTAGGKRAGA
jgi:hypothetical protein